MREDEDIKAYATAVMAVIDECSGLIGSLAGADKNGLEANCLPFSMREYYPYWKDILTSIKDVRRECDELEKSLQKLFP